ncbi:MULTISPECIES: XkdX family protein [Lacticaseibacillus]|nr:XkdX family protein [Lacticaseibacillus casei]MBI6598849.1 XkdX family protein [Lacticaseibacillus casei]MBO1482520.1 XkdX family protein [Lacticaseibacillus casei]MBO2417803.1 XkdX family protein [Lacticaseibacillus casei]MCK2082175.1 XkdX family protein [Lacticaseibacillus casei]MED7631879.1 XkdX family protein [Lacticaseibacillus casei]
MTDYDMCQRFYAWGIDIEPYVGLMITADEYKQITGNDYVASKS